MKLAKIFILVFLMVISKFSYGQYDRYSSSQYGVFYTYTKGIKKLQDYTSDCYEVWTKEEAKEGKILQWRKTFIDARKSKHIPYKGLDKLLSIKTRYYVDVSNNRIKIQECVMFGVDGSIIESEHYEEYDEWISCVPESVAELLVSKIEGYVKEGSIEIE